jgi:hypothetical protein
MLRTEIQSIHPTDPSVPLLMARTQPLPSFSQQMDVLSQEMENMVIERNLMQESGPLRTLWEGAINRRRAFSTSDSAGPRGSYSARQNGTANGLPSPVSDEDGERLPPRIPVSQSTAWVHPGMQRSSGSYVRARSVSY